MNKPWYLLPCIFVYKAILFIIKLPIKFIKYFSLGFFFTSTFFIDMVITSIYQFFKYLIYGFIMICKLLYLGIRSLVRLFIPKKKQKENIVEPKEFVMDNPSVTLDEIVTNNVETNNINENINENINQDVINIDNSNDELLSIPEITEIETENKETPVINEGITAVIETKPAIEPKEKFDFKKLLVIFKPFKWLMYGFIYECYLMYNLFKYLLFGIVFPAILIYVGITNLLLNYRLSVEKRQIEKEKKYQERQRKEQEEIERRKLEQEKNTYINENVKEEKRTFNDKINDFFISVGEFPSKIKQGISNWYHNLSIIKNLENKKNIASEALLLNFDGEDALKSDKKIVYEYRAKNPEGKVITDYFEAYSKVEVHSFLLSEGYEVYSIRTSKSIQFLHGSSTFGTVKFKNKDLIFFLTQLSTYLKAGITLVEALKILSRQYSKNRNYQKIFRKMIYDLTMGDSFSTALEKQGEVFPRILINMIKASEMTGELPETLDKMADYFTEANKTRQQMITAITYPIIVLVLALGVLTFIMLYIIPKFVAIYDAMDNVQIPGITRTILGISEFLQANILWVCLGILAFLLMFMYLYKNIKSFRTIIQLFLMKLPVFGNIIIYNEITIFTQTLGTLLSHNVFITDSMSILNKITNNEVYKMIILDTINNIANGEKISEAFNHWAFPLPAYEMIVTGEKTGQLPEMMEKVGAYYQELHRNSVARIKTFIEPVLIIVLTALVGVIVLSIVVPMFSMYDAIGTAA